MNSRNEAITKGQPAQKKPEITIPATIDDDVDNMVISLLKMKRDWKIIMNQLMLMSKKKT